MSQFSSILYTRHYYPEFESFVFAIAALFFSFVLMAFKTESDYHSPTSVHWRVLLNRYARRIGQQVAQDVAHEMAIGRVVVLYCTLIQYISGPFFMLSFYFSLLALIYPPIFGTRILLNNLSFWTIWAGLVTVLICSIIYLFQRAVIGTIPRTYPVSPSG